MLAICWDRETRAKITRRMNLWERSLHMRLVGDVEADGSARKVRAACGGEEEDKALARSFHGTVLSGKVLQAVFLATNKEGV